MQLSLTGGPTGNFLTSVKHGSYKKERDVISIYLASALSYEELLNIICFLTN